MNCLNPKLKIYWGKKKLKKSISFSRVTFTFLSLMQRFKCFNNAVIHYEQSVQKLQCLLQLLIKLGLESYIKSQVSLH